MWFDQSAPVLAVADTTRPILLIVFVLSLFVLAGLGVFFGRKHVAAQNARALSDDVGLSKGAERGGDGTFDANWYAEVRDDVTDAPRQSFADVLGLQGIEQAQDTGFSPFGGAVETGHEAYDPAVYAAADQPAYEVSTYEAPAYPVQAVSEAPAVPVYAAETPFGTPEQSVAFADGADAPGAQAPVYQSPAYEDPDVATSAPEASVYTTPAYEAPSAAAPTYEAPTAVTAPAPAPAPVAPIVPAAPGEEYASFFGATPPPPPPPPVEPFNIWATDADER